MAFKKPQHLLRPTVMFICGFVSRFSRSQRRALRRSRQIGFFGTFWDAEGRWSRIEGRGSRVEDRGPSEPARSFACSASFDLRFSILDPRHDASTIPAALRAAEPCGATIGASSPAAGRNRRRIFPAERLLIPTALRRRLRVGTEGCVAIRQALHLCDSRKV